MLCRPCTAKPRGKRTIGASFRLHSGEPPMAPPRATHRPPPSATTSCWLSIRSCVAKIRRGCTPSVSYKSGRLVLIQRHRSIRLIVEPGTVSVDPVHSTMNLFYRISRLGPCPFIYLELNLFSSENKFRKCLKS
jgi:hypothetical protein